MPAKVRDAIRRLRSAGWSYVYSRGSHHYFKHSLKPGKITLAGRLGKDVPEGIWRSIQRQAGITEEED